MSKNKEAEIISGFISGDTQTIESIYEGYFPVVRNHILKNSGTETEAKDIFQDAVVFTYQKLKSDSLSLNCSLTTYIFAVCRNMWMNTLRKRRKIIKWDEVPEVSEDINNDILNIIQEKSKSTIFQKYFLNLGEVCQQVLRNFFLGKSMLEISELMNYSVGYTRKKKFECKKRLIEMIERDPTYQELKEK